MAETQTQRIRAPTIPPPDQLLTLADRIDAALDLEPAKMEVAVLNALLAVLVGERWLPNERRRANHENYARHLLYGDPLGRFSILSIVWDRGQASPCHGHYTWCATGVYDNILQETQFKQLPGGTVEETGVTLREQGSCSFDLPLTCIHSIGNFTESPSISLHIYGVGADQVTTSINKIYHR